MNDSQTQRIDLESLNRKVRPVSSMKQDGLDLFAVSADNIAAESNQGFVRLKNEDSFAYCTKENGNFSFAMVADGIGGQSFGEVASWMCARHMITAWRKFTKIHAPSLAMSENFLYTEIENSNREIYDYSQQMTPPVMMGTTIAAILFSNRKIITAHAGDSRIYRLRDNILELLTRDHTLVEKLVEQGEISEDDALNHPLSHVISKSIGPTPFADAEMNILDHQPGDRYLLCTDGLTIHLTHAEIKAAMIKAMIPSETIAELMDTVVHRGAKDNVTMIAMFA